LIPREAGKPASKVNMSSTPVNKARRYLVVSTAAVGGLGVVATAVPFVGSLFPSERAKAAGAPVEVDISKLEPGQKMDLEWRGKVVWVVRRTPDMLASLEKAGASAADPESKNKKQQPEYAANKTRSIKPEVLVVEGVCTHLGCSPTFRKEIAPADLGADWVGGFYCPCHGSKFDLAGRVYKGSPAPTNLVVPPHTFLAGDTKVLIGVDSKSA
jgi:ubiquinol-cytochrome c reductase iron-sulfur subunit